MADTKSREQLRVGRQTVALSNTGKVRFRCGTVLAPGAARRAGSGAAPLG
jgi:hypothetical protein